ncbi:aprataxin-like protein [Orbilia oligospora]|uniref:Aprataxin-like protein n=1 Tax=Orbilia oligospora TaxID=2813651 RepID=A0A8H8UV07_ORBOL|nr:aprataxin-like protein [Orbilia oligospora]
MDESVRISINSRPVKRRRHDIPADEDETDSASSRTESPPSLGEASSSHGVAAPKTTVAEGKKKNAFTELMSKKPKPNPPAPKTQRPSPNPYFLNSDPRAGLAVYLADPASVPSKSMLFYNDDFVVIKDAFPKATVHALILPRNISITHLQPLELLNSNPELLASIRKIALQTRDLLAKELCRIHLKTSALEQTRQKAFEELEERAISEPGFDPDSEESQALLPPGRNWASCIKIGVHARPSMSNLHIHVISEDMHSERVKKKNHYNSFNSGFFVNLDEFPLDKDDERIPGVGHVTNGMLKGDMVCWRCKKNFKNHFKELKDHLEVEYEAWKMI